MARTGNGASNQLATWLDQSIGFSGTRNRAVRIRIGAVDERNACIHVSGGAEERPRDRNVQRVVDQVQSTGGHFVQEQLGRPTQGRPNPASGRPNSNTRAAPGVPDRIKDQDVVGEEAVPGAGHRRRQRGLAFGGAAREGVHIAVASHDARMEREQSPVQGDRRQCRTRTVGRRPRQVGHPPNHLARSPPSTSSRSPHGSRTSWRPAPYSQTTPLLSGFGSVSGTFAAPNRHVGTASSQPRHRRRLEIEIGVHGKGTALWFVDGRIGSGRTYSALNPHSRWPRRRTAWTTMRRTCTRRLCVPGSSRRLRPRRPAARPPAKARWARKRSQWVRRPRPGFPRRAPTGRPERRLRRRSPPGGGSRRRRACPATRRTGTDMLPLPRGPLRRAVRFGSDPSVAAVKPLDAHRPLPPGTDLEALFAAEAGPRPSVAQADPRGGRAGDGQAGTPLRPARRFRRAGQSRRPRLRRSPAMNGSPRLAATRPAVLPFHQPRPEQRCPAPASRSPGRRSRGPGTRT